MLYKLLVYIHIVSVIMSIGPFFVILPMAKKLRAVDGEVQQVYLDSFRFAVRLTKHAGHVLVVSGILLVMLGPWTWKTSWIVITVLIMVSSLFFLARAFTPLLRRFVESGHNRNQLVSKLFRTTVLYVALLLLMLWFMVTKPIFW